MKHKTKKNAYRIGDRLVVDMTDLTARGEGVAHHNGLTVFVGGALPGERAQLRVDVVKQAPLNIPCISVTLDVSHFETTDRKSVV